VEVEVVDDITDQRQGDLYDLGLVVRSPTWFKKLVDIDVGKEDVGLGSSDPRSIPRFQCDIAALRERGTRCPGGEYFATPLLLSGWIERRSRAAMDN
jgi:hypothetical protein